MKQLTIGQLGRVSAIASRMAAHMRTLGIAIIWLVTAFDIYCCQWLTVDGELNPLAAMTMSFGSVWSLVSLKVVGTFIATEILRKLHWGYLAVFDVLGLCLVGYLLT